MFKSKTFSKFIVVFSLLLTTACTNSGSKQLATETSTTLKQKITDGMSKQEVQATIGQPLDISYTDSGNEIWKYEYIDATPTAESFIPVVSLLSSGVEGTKSVLVIFFGDDEKVKKHSFTIGDYQAKTGLME